MKKRMKLMAIILALALVLGLLAACGDSGAAGSEATGTTQPSASQPAQESTPASEEPSTVPSEEPTPSAEPSAEPEPSVEPEPEPVVIVESDVANYLWEIPEGATDEEIMNLTVRNYKIIQSFQPLFTEESYKEYSNVYSMKYKRNKDVASAKEAIAAQSVLQQILTVEDGVIFLWGDNVGPMVDGESYTEEELDAAVQDAYGFKPFLIKYLLDDPSTAKGNIIMISGGGMYQRSNPAEGYPAAEIFREMGYNCFLLQRRVEPYVPTDIYMDLQRAIRLVRYYAEVEGWGGQDMIAACGFSGGGATILGAIRNCYGDMLPTVYDSDYVPDEIDALNSDLDAALIIYGSYNADGVGTYVGDNPNLPAFYICHGTADDTIPCNNAQELYDLVSGTVPAQLYLVEGAKHGFGPGHTSTAAEGCKVWPSQADAFMQANKGHSGN